MKKSFLIFAMYVFLANVLLSQGEYEHIKVVPDADTKTYGFSRIAKPGKISVFIIGTHWCGPCIGLKKKLNRDIQVGIIDGNAVDIYDYTISKSSRQKQSDFLRNPSVIHSTYIDRITEVFPTIYITTQTTNCYTIIKGAKYDDILMKINDLMKVQDLFDSNSFVYNEQPNVEKNISVNSQLVLQQEYFTAYIDSLKSIIDQNKLTKDYSPQFIEKSQSSDKNSTSAFKVSDLSIDLLDSTYDKVRLQINLIGNRNFLGVPYINASNISIVMNDKNSVDLVGVSSYNDSVFSRSVTDESRNHSLHFISQPFSNYFSMFSSYDILELKIINVTGNAITIEAIIKTG